MDLTPELVDQVTIAILDQINRTVEASLIIQAITTAILVAWFGVWLHRTRGGKSLYRLLMKWETSGSSFRMTAEPFRYGEIPSPSNTCLHIQWHGHIITLSLKVNDSQKNWPLRGLINLTTAW